MSASPSPGAGANGASSSKQSIPDQPQPVKGSPNDFLRNMIGKPVVVRLNSGIDYKGILSCLDGYMNIAMEDTTEWVDGVEKNRYGDAFIRGNNVLYFTADKQA